jgi:hypothetical protein
MKCDRTARRTPNSSARYPARSDPMTNPSAPLRDCNSGQVATDRGPPEESSRCRLMPIGDGATWSRYTAMSSPTAASTRISLKTAPRRRPSVIGRMTVPSAGAVQPSAHRSSRTPAPERCPKPRCGRWRSSTRPRDLRRRKNSG